LLGESLYEKRLFHVGVNVLSKVYDIDLASLNCVKWALQCILVKPELSCTSSVYGYLYLLVLCYLGEVFLVCKSSSSSLSGDLV